MLALFFCFAQMLFLLLFDLEGRKKGEMQFKNLRFFM